MKNNYEVRGDVTAIFLNSPKYGNMETLISTRKLEIVKEYPHTWCASYEKITNKFYVSGNVTIEGKRKIIRLHRIVAGAPRGTDVDHKNHKTLDNTDGNLRILSHSENLQNRVGAQTNSTSGVRGVYWIERVGKWKAEVVVNKKVKYLGLYEDLKEAKSVVIQARKEHMPYSKEAEEVS